MCEGSSWVLLASGGSGSSGHPGAQVADSPQPGEEAGGLSPGAEPEQALPTLLGGKKEKKKLDLNADCILFAIGRDEEDFVEQCIERASCLSVAVRKQSCGVGGYLISTKWQKDFWLLA
ncbi:hypothetical protein Taro_005129 [Colocasia esculenta]|uniref:Uncharacterized protein n=1 Tax=Colocasia esculenta TaxID=4460 RepID=A0A843TWW3_COLES|nr:hypothetical protein [Colocasia esculenta]